MFCYVLMKITLCLGNTFTHKLQGYFTVRRAIVCETSMTNMGTGANPLFEPMLIHCQLDPVSNKLQ